MSPSEPIRPAAWEAILDSIDRALARSMATIPAPAEHAGAEAPPASPDAGAPLAQAVGACDVRLHGLRSCAARAERDGAEADELLAATENAIQGWLAAAAAVRQQLADGAANPV